MRTSFAIAIVATIASFSLAIPTDKRQTFVCSTGSPECCDVDVLGLADLDCTTPPTVPTTASNFTAICAAIGKIDMCCDIPILEQGLICNKPAGAKRLMREV